MVIWLACHFLATYAKSTNIAGPLSSWCSVQVKFLAPIYVVYALCLEKKTYYNKNWNNHIKTKTSSIGAQLALCHMRHTYGCTNGNLQISCAWSILLKKILFRMSWLCLLHQGRFNFAREIYKFIWGLFKWKSYYFNQFPKNFSFSTLF